jgi:hypothetical protein
VFVFSVKTSRRQLWSLLLCVGVLILILVAAFAWPAAGQTAAPVAGDNTARIEYLKSLGYEVDLAFCEVREVQIPEEFDEVFAAYNEMQKTTGMDLAPYHGRRLKCWSYRVLGGGGGETLAHLYVYQNEIVGGDISETVAGGRTTGLIPRV